MNLFSDILCSFTFGSWWHYMNFLWLIVNVMSNTVLDSHSHRLSRWGLFLYFTRGLGLGWEDKYLPSLKLSWPRLVPLGGLLLFPVLPQELWNVGEEEGAAEDEQGAKPVKSGERVVEVPERLKCGWRSDFLELTKWKKGVRGTSSRWPPRWR